MLQATNPAADVLLAYEMNGEVIYFNCIASLWKHLYGYVHLAICELWILTWQSSHIITLDYSIYMCIWFISQICSFSKVLKRDHGYPLRAIVPGVIGARSVKWLDKIDIIEEESQVQYAFFIAPCSCLSSFAIYERNLSFLIQGFFMQKDYKMFPPSVDWDNIVWSTRKPQMDFFILQILSSLIFEIFLRYQHWTSGSTEELGYNIILFVVTYYFSIEPQIGMTGHVTFSSSCLINKL